MNELMDETSMNIREMEEKDLRQVAEIEKEIFSQPWSEKGFFDSMKDRATMYLCAVLDTRVVGYCGFLQVLDEADITNVAVCAGCRQKGIGEKMLQELLHRGLQRGVYNFTLEVRQSNQAAIRLYEKIGFEKCGIRKDFYDLPKENAVIMWKRY